MPEALICYRHGHPRSRRPPGAESRPMPCTDIPVRAEVCSRDPAGRFSHQQDAGDRARAARLRTKRQRGVLFALLLNAGLEITEEAAGALELPLAKSFGKRTL